MQRGIEMRGVRVTCGSRHRLSLLRAPDALTRRARAAWDTLYLNCDLNDAEIWLKTPAAASDADRDEVHTRNYHVYTIKLSGMLQMWKAFL